MTTMVRVAVAAVVTGIQAMNSPVDTHLFCSGLLMIVTSPFVYLLAGPTTLVSSDPAGFFLLGVALFDLGWVRRQLASLQEAFDRLESKLRELATGDLS